jgi:processive 1,2-diacylglycerol beta-glucosyltransferase
MGLYNQLLNKTIKNIYIKMIKRTPKLYGTLYQSTQHFSYDSVFQRVVNKIGHKPLTEYIESLNTDIIICTYPSVAGLLAHLRTKGRLNVPLVTVVTDFSIHSHWIHPGVDLYIVGNTEVRDGLIARGIRPETIRVTGIPVSPKFDRFLDRDHILCHLGLKIDRLTF